MAVKRTVKTPPPTPPPARSTLPAGAEDRGHALLAPLTPQIGALKFDDVRALTLDEMAEVYENADAMLGRVQTARKKWRGEMYGTDPKEESGPIPSIRKGLDALYELNRKIDRPLEDLEKVIKGTMTTIKGEEHRRLMAAEQERLAEEARLRRIEEEARAKAEAAPTPQLAGRFTKQAEAAVIAQEVLQETPAPQPMQGFNSTTRDRKKWRLQNRTEFAKGCIDGTLGPEWLDVSVEGKRTLDELLKSDPDALAAYPGIEVYDDILIVGR